jgi:hypothetical protein
MGGKATMTYTLDKFDRENIGELNRESIEDWLTTHSGDFQSIIDFSASLDDLEIPWSNEESEFEYGDITYPSED